MVGGQHLAVDEPLRALLPRLHARRLRDAARRGKAARVPPPRCLRAPPTPAAARPFPARFRGSRRRGRRVGGPARGSARVLARVRRHPAAAAASPARPLCAPAGSAAAAAAAHRLPTREPCARRLSMPSTPPVSPPSASPRRRGGSARRPGLGSAAAAATRGSRRLCPPPALRVSELTQPQASGDCPSGRLPGLATVWLDTGYSGVLPGTPLNGECTLKGVRGAKD